MRRATYIEVMIKERAYNMIYSKLVFADKKLDDLKTEMIEGSKIGRSILERAYDSQEKECLTLYYILEKL